MPGRSTSRRSRCARARRRPTTSSTTFYIERLEVDLGLLALVARCRVGRHRREDRARPHRRQRSRISKQGTSIDLEGTNLPSAMLPMREAHRAADVRQDRRSRSISSCRTRRASRAAPARTGRRRAGAISFDCPSGLHVRRRQDQAQAQAQEHAQSGVRRRWHRLRQDQHRHAARAGHDQARQARAVDEFEAKSQDGELHVDFSMTLAPQFNESMVAGCLRFKGSDALLQARAEDPRGADRRPARASGRTTCSTSGSTASSTT